jgi:hypothetical protein
VEGGRGEAGTNTENAEIKEQEETRKAKRTADEEEGWQPRPAAGLGDGRWMEK